MTIDKYEETLTDQSRHIIESDKNMKPYLDKIDDLVSTLEQDMDEGPTAQD